MEQTQSLKDRLDAAVTTRPTRQEPARADAHANAESWLSHAHKLRTDLQHRLVASQADWEAKRREIVDRARAELREIDAEHQQRFGELQRLADRIGRVMEAANV